MDTMQTFTADRIAASRRTLVENKKPRSFRSGAEILTLEV
jgi:hypothetical protein